MGRGNPSCETILTKGTRRIRFLGDRGTKILKPNWTPDSGGTKADQRVITLSITRHRPNEGPTSLRFVFHLCRATLCL